MRKPVFVPARGMVKVGFGASSDHIAHGLLQGDIHPQSCLLPLPGINQVPNMARIDMARFQLDQDCSCNCALVFICISL